MNDDVFAPEVPLLLREHYQALHEGSGLSIEAIKNRGYRSILGKKNLHELGLSKSQCRIPGLLLPSYAPDGTSGPSCYRPDSPRIVRDKTIEI